MGSKTALKFQQIAKQVRGPDIEDRGERTMKRTEINIMCTGKDGKDIKCLVSAWESGIPGLVLHHPLADIREDGVGIVTDRGWQISTSISGKGFGSFTFDTRKEAAIVAQQLAPLADWTLSEAKLTAIEGLGAKALEIFRNHSAQLY